MKFKSQMAFIFFSLGLVLSSCEKVETPNGEIPSEALKYVQNVVGQYRSAAGAVIDVQVQGNHLITTFLGSEKYPGIDLFGQTCGFDLGQMKSLEYINLGNEVRALFEMINPKNCGAAKPRQIEASVYHDQKQNVIRIIFRYVRFIDTECDNEGICKDKPWVIRETYWPVQ